MEFKTWLEYNWRDILGDKVYVSEKIRTNIRKMNTEFAVIEGFGDLKEREIFRTKDEKEAEAFSVQHKAKTLEILKSSNPDLVPIYWVKVTAVQSK